MFQVLVEDREAPKIEPIIDGHSGFLFYDKEGMSLVAMHWQHRFNHMVNRYNEIYRIQIPNITPHVCRYTYCSNMAKAGHESKDTAISYGAFGYKRNDECVHTCEL